MRELKNKESTNFLLRITSVKYANALLDEGSIKFNKPKQWIKYGKLYGDGRGDLREGTLAYYDIYDYKNSIKIYKEVTDIILNNSRPEETLLKEIQNIPNGIRILIKDKRSLNLPCFCLYSIKDKDLFKYQKYTIAGSCFKDFADNASEEELKFISYSERPAILIIRDVEAFIDKVTRALKQIGVQKDEILCEFVTYLDFKENSSLVWNIFDRDFPRELFIKSDIFKEQKELRIIINTKNEKIIKLLEDEPLCIGSIKKIAKVIKGYFHEGIEVKLKNETAKS